jgi:hypothetical protein
VCYHRARGQMKIGRTKKLHLGWMN